MSLKKQLERYKTHLSRDTNGLTQEKPAIQKDTDKQNIYDKELLFAAENLGAEIKTFDGQFVLVRTEQFSLSERLGPYSFACLFDVVAEWQKDRAPHPLSAYNRRAEELLFFDTETTGLESGAGHMIFLIGWAKVTREGVTLKQYFLPGPGHEAAFYHHFLTDCHSLSNLVTFNGKAFDWPRVKTRHQFVKDQVPKLPAFGHFDLLHASRRLWKSRLESTRLQMIEKEILGINRDGDIPGHMAPFLYFQFLKQPNAALVEGVLKHNLDDIKTLITLYVHLSCKILRPFDADERELFEIGRWHQSLRNDQKAIETFEQLLGSQSLLGSQAKKSLAALYKKRGRYKEALSLYEECIREGKMRDPALYIEAAKLLEHQFKDIEHALHYTKEALQELGRMQVLLKEKQETEKEKILHRYERLKAKRI
ncbi:hypothetical protein EV207_10225 [Scopulibacillus darangshiensis]|uniref:YprB ribonuclease H-like domain-containing protein n=1 Tax=Scopulibacillus darangshiensis TaxID=442528 RepID=A0A4V2SNL1_9BACL|nr:ribonuclease H-like domain-containing protein [Scopulibacillus darangshiensis]TCP31536.1 hypothetical protein EV207_10225 [Scopulibacillus darangshiensis]